MLWLPEPEPGTKVCGGFDGSENNDWTALKLETIDGLLFTPRYGPDLRPTIWNPAEWGGRIPRAEVGVAVREVAARFRLRRLYCDPEGWVSEVGEWSTELGGPLCDIAEWPTNAYRRMHGALSTTLVDLSTGRLRHDGCPITTVHAANAVKKAQPRETYTIQKPHGADHQKIDAIMAGTLAHEAACDARAAGWAAESGGKLTRATGRTRTY